MRDRREEHARLMRQLELRSVLVKPRERVEVLLGNGGRIGCRDESVGIAGVADDAHLACLLRHLHSGRLW